MHVQPMERQKCNQRPMRTCLKRNAGAGLPSRGGREVKSPERTLGESEAHPVVGEQCGLLSGGSEGTSEARTAQAGSEKWKEG